MNGTQSVNYTRLPPKAPPNSAVNSRNTSPKEEPLKPEVKQSKSIIRLKDISRQREALKALDEFKKSQIMNAWLGDVKKY